MYYCFCNLYVYRINLARYLANVRIVMSLKKIQSINQFMEDLVQLIRNEQKGVNNGDLNVSILLYADDIVLLSDCEEDLQ